MLIVPYDLVTTYGVGAIVVLGVGIIGEGLDSGDELVRISTYLEFGNDESPLTRGGPTNLSPPLDSWKPDRVPSA